MTATQQFFLDILAGYIRAETSSPPPPGVDWGQLFQLAQAHGLTGTVWAQCRAVPEIPPEALKKLHNGLISSVFHDTCIGQDFREVTAALAGAGIPVLSMKGMLLRRDYPVPQLRTMGDVDLVIRPEDRSRCHEVMTGLGFSCMVDNHAVWTYTRDVVTYEIHDHMMYEDLANSVDYRGYFDRVWEHAAPGPDGLWIPEAGYHFLYLMVHNAKHTMNKGNGFRAYLDLVFFCRGEGRNLDWPRISRELEKLRLLEFTRTCFALCESWFGVKMPIPGRALEEDFLEEITEKTFRDGLFGLENRENRTGGSAKAIRRSRLPYGLAAVKVTLHKLFPPYGDMQLIPWYSFVDGRPWLLPVAWIYRFFYCLRHKSGHSMALLEEPYTCREEIKERQAMLSRWGL